VNISAAPHKTGHSYTDADNFQIPGPRFGSKIRYPTQHPATESIPTFGYQAGHPAANDDLTGR
jgi:hypothetical protein